MSQTEVQLIKADAVQTGDIANSAVTDAKISGIASSKLTGALPAISGAALTNLPASGKAHNLIINGAMLVAQRGTSSTSEGYHTIDRCYVGSGGTDEAPTQAQVDVASGTTPYTLGFRKALRITNGNQTSGAGTADFMYLKYTFEAQDIANSGWNYLSSSSYVTLSFWVKSSVAQSFKAYFHTRQGTEYQYPFETGSLSADTWTKVTKTISGNSNLTFNSDNGLGLELYIWSFIGTDYTASSVTEDAWSTYANAARMKDATSTWYTTNDATFEITGVQLEVGSQATPFEWRSFHEERQLCYRYYFRQQPNNGAYFGQGFVYNAAANGGANAQINGLIHMPVRLRSKPSSVETSGTASHYRVIANASTITCSSVPSHGGDLDDLIIGVNFHTAASGNTNGEGRLFRSGSSSAFLGFDAEL